MVDYHLTGMDLYTSSPTQSPKDRRLILHNDPKIVAIVEVKDLKQTFEIETGYGHTNAWVEWIKYTVQSLNHSNCYVCTTGRPTAQVVPFHLGWTQDPRGIKCMIALYQEKAAWGNETCKSLALLFSAVQNKDRENVSNFPCLALFRAENPSVWPC
uniref:Uncharacterized protein n=1 Tax=Athene cunicularia TaxID=194338 RepID=A0A663N9D2_ATHCN